MTTYRIKKRDELLSDLACELNQLGTKNPTVDHNRVEVYFLDKYGNELVSGVNVWYAFYLLVEDVSWDDVGDWSDTYKLSVRV